MKQTVEKKGESRQGDKGTHGIKGRKNEEKMN